MASSFSSFLRRVSLLHHRRHFLSSVSPIFDGRDGSTALTRRVKSKAIISLLKSEQDPERILDICRAASVAKRFHFDPAAFSVAISKLADSNYFERIRGFIEELKTSRTDLRTERFAAQSIILYGQAGMIDDAIATFKEMGDLGIERTEKTLNSLLSACILAKKYGEAQRIFADFPRMYGIKPNLETYNLVIKAFCESGTSSSGYSVLASMESSGIKPNAITFGNLIAGFHAEEKLEDVGKVLKMMEERGIKPTLEIFNIRIKSLCKLRRSVEAKALLDVMLSRGVKGNSKTFSLVIHGFCEEGKLEDAKKLYSVMRKFGCKPDSDCYFTIIYFLARGGDYETALSLCKESIEMNWFPNFTTMKLLVDGLVCISKVDEARDLIAQIKNKFPNKAHLWKETEESLPNT